MRSSSKNLKVITVVAISTIWIFLILFAAEFLFRMNPKYKFSGIAYDKSLGWRFVKGLHTRQYSKVRKKTISFSTNSIGFRDREHSLKKAKGIKRIIFLGDSYVAGVFVSDEEILTRLFEEKLHKGKNNDDIEYDVMNISVPAWATDQQLLFLQNEGMRYKPDYIFLIIAPNDIREAYVKGFFVLDADNSLKWDKLPSFPWKERFCWFLSNRSSLYQFLQKEILKTNFGDFVNIFAHFPVFWHIAGAPSVDAPLFLERVPNEVTKARNLFKTILLEINSLCIKEKCKLILTVIPTKMEFNHELKDNLYRPGNISNYVKSIALENNITFLDLFSDLQKENNPLMIFNLWEFHLSPEGHRYVAQKLYSFFATLKQ